MASKEPGGGGGGGGERTALVTGATGITGRHCVDALLRDQGQGGPWRVVTLARRDLQGLAAADAQRVTQAHGGGGGAGGGSEGAPCRARVRVLAQVSHSAVALGTASAAARLRPPPPQVKGDLQAGGGSVAAALRGAGVPRVTHLFHCAYLM